MMTQAEKEGNKEDKGEKQRRDGPGAYRKIS